MKNGYLDLWDINIISNRNRIYQHWCGKSQVYAGADTLLHLLQQGYYIQEYVIREILQFRGNRCTNFYHFPLKHETKQAINLPVLRNPIVVRVIQQLNLKILNLQEV